MAENDERTKIGNNVDNNDSEKSVPAPNHWQLIRDIVVFQAKLALDGLRDVVLVPLSLAAGIAGIVMSPDNPGKYFNRLLDMGRKSDVWINLFAAKQHYPDDDASDTRSDASSSDAYIEKLEEMLVTEYKRGGVVKNLKDRTDNLIERARAEPRQEDSAP